MGNVCNEGPDKLGKDVYPNMEDGVAQYKPTDRKNYLHSFVYERHN